MPTYRSEVFNKNYSGTRLLTGFRQFDEACSGIPTGRLLIIFADTNVGKTKLALTLSRNFCFNKNPDGSSVKGTYFDLENGRAALWKDCVKVFYGKNDNFFTDISNADEYDELTGLFDVEGDLKTVFLEELDNYSKKNKMTIFEAMGVEMLKSKKEGRSFFVIDPLQILTMYRKDFVKEYDFQAEIIAKLSNFAQMHNLLVIVLHHVNKGVRSKSRYVREGEEDKEREYRVTEIEDMEGSKKVSNRADMIWSLERHYKSQSPNIANAARVKIHKNRIDNYLTPFSLIYKPETSEFISGMTKKQWKEDKKEDENEDK